MKRTSAPPGVLSIEHDQVAHKSLLWKGILTDSLGLLCFVFAHIVVDDVGT